MIERPLKVFFLFVLQTILSYPLDSFVYESNPVQRLYIPYSDKDPTKPIKFKVQATSFNVYEQLAGLNSGKDSDDTIENKNIRKYEESTSSNDSKLRELEKKYKQLSRFTVLYEDAEDKPKPSIVMNSTNRRPIDMNIIDKNTTVATNNTAKILTSKDTTKYSKYGDNDNNSSNEMTDIFNTTGTTEISQFGTDIMATEYVIDSTMNPVEDNTTTGIDTIPNDTTESIESDFEITYAEKTDSSTENIKIETTTEILLFESHKHNKETDITSTVRDEELHNAVIITERITEAVENTKPTIFITTCAPPTTEMENY